ncbi:hypothetical protein IMZ31_21790 (plasmid) [Pontibacillus sp. ALD_SL1]|uniref:hypothetical protein n=1 Tax=Pontibacillus sp. ALD_SL1 TaxID=2777185 RepID=UPI001A974028|nr:hypothetical protein [Pontibacillus sp. ALD_SL1]QST02085.1 hypothetical protein IMZ31_21790 [Pontibacillus sp. ALD_SL1]
MEHLKRKVLSVLKEKGFVLHQGEKEAIPKKAYMIRDYPEIKHLEFALYGRGEEKLHDPLYTKDIYDALKEEGFGDLSVFFDGGNVLNDGVARIEFYKK